MNVRHLRETVFVVAFVSFNLAAKTYYVNASNPSPASPYTNWATAAVNIQDAAALTFAGDTVLVTNGIYQNGGATSGGSSNRLISSFGLTIQSVNGPAVTIIKGYQVPGTTNGANAVRCVYLHEGSTLSGFTLTNGATPTSGISGFDLDGGGVIAESQCMVSNCVITGNAAAVDGGGTYSGNASMLVNCLITGNVAFSSGGGSYGNVLNNCVVTNNYAPHGAGLNSGTANNCLFVGNGSTNSVGGTDGGAAENSTLSSCTLVRNFSRTLGAAETCMLTNSIVYDNFNSGSLDCYECFLTSCCTPLGAGVSVSLVNTISNAPAFVDLAHDDYHLQIGSPGIDAGTNVFAPGATDLDGNPRVFNGIVDMGAYENQNTYLVHYVNLSNSVPVSPFTNWLTAATNIQDAVAVAQAGEVVVVADGIYKNGGAVVYGAESNRVALTNAITLLSLYGPQSAVIVGNTLGSTTRCVYVGTNAVLYGFTMVDGTTATSGDTIKEQSGGGAWCETSGVISNCVFGSSGFPYADGANPGDGCTAQFEGGAVYGGNIYNCLMGNNTTVAEGGAAAAANLINCLLTNNTCSVGYAAGIFQGFASNCTFYGNVNNAVSLPRAGGAYQSTLYNCTFASNRGYTGAAYDCTNYGCVMTNNTGSQGGGVNGCVLYNCVLSSNTASGPGGGACESTLYNCLMVSNRSSNVGGGAYNSTSYSCTLSNNSALQGGGGVYQGTLFNCVVSGNHNGGAYVATLFNCVVSGNTYVSGAGAFASTLYNCLLISNTATSNGGGANGGSLYNCTVVGNSAPLGGGVYGSALYNSIVYYNSGATSSNYSGGTLAYCDTTPLATGLGNITNDPTLVNFPVDLHLQSTSPCINSGNNSYLTTNTDFAGNPRIVGGTVDIGAYEFQSPTSTISYAWLQQYGFPTDGSADYLDSDGTGMNNWQKWIAGLNPTDPTSVLAMLPPTIKHAGVTVSWKSVNTRSYYLQRATDLTLQPTFSAIQSNLVGQASSTSFTDTTATNGGPYFYRVGVQ